MIYYISMTQAQALEILKLGHNVFLTGQAGAGKTYVLNQYIEYLQEEGIEVAKTASTGIAATHIDGITIHSWSGIGVANDLTEKDLVQIKKRTGIRKRIQKAKVLLIDEVSMLHDFQLNMIDAVCRFIRENREPFGGIQVILSGDFFQLPPVSSENKPVQFIHSSRSWEEMDLRVCYLESQFRQDDEAFLRILNDIRGNAVDEDTYETLKERFHVEMDDSVVPTKLYTHNADVDQVNMWHLKQIEEKQHLYKMSEKGIERYANALKANCLAPEILPLKIGAAVMFLKNNFEKGYVNGTLGTVVDFDEYQCPIVYTVNGDEIAVRPESWAIEEDGKTLASIKQMPLRLAWAITVHKSQGMTLDAAEVDLSKCFVPGMGYVALSRVRSLSGLRLIGMNELSLVVLPEVLDIDDELRGLSQRAENQLEKMKPKERKKKQREFIATIT